MEEMQNRENWIAVMSNDRYIVVDKTTGITIYDAQGYGFKNASKCWNWIRSQQRQVGITFSEPTQDALF
jgi:hypothetical protein